MIHKCGCVFTERELDDGFIETTVVNICDKHREENSYRYVWGRGADKYDDV